MSALAKLKLVTAKRPAQMPPIVMRRQKIADRIFEQIAMATAKQDGKTYAPTKMRTTKNAATGESATVEVAKKLKEWWFTDGSSGKCCVSVRYGAKVIPLNAKGATAVELDKASDLLATLEALRKLVLDGELDTQIETICGAVKLNFKK
ncbi:MAG: hypothetical protein HYZ65_11785 [Burkholderiales bacterium]|nr:hypothetical protein [Burkholderiales bacterium]